ncbi:hydrolase [Streptomyces sp. A7024]|uniref:Hydrolase n=1 Tax=Streptomyces coryli TaxID=1128680 RepID=A0A6G4TRN6_9ACTN|nr:HAD family phosphatase [Streptomyces coryli]NGN62452.1 hydrolase [Streptomyces coryli]
MGRVHALVDSRALIPRLHGMRGAVLDADSVLTFAAHVHAAAWKRTFDTFFKEFIPPAPALLRPFDPVADYWRHFAGRTSTDGVAGFLDARGIHLPPGQAVEPPGWSSARSLQAFEDRVFADYVDRYRVLAAPGAFRLVRELRSYGIGVAAVSPARGTADMLSRAGGRALADEVIDIRFFGTRLFHGPPDPPLLLAAVERLGVARSRTTAILGSPAGVTAARRAGLGLVVAVAAYPSPALEQKLVHAGAHLVLRNVRELLARTAVEPAPSRSA